MRNAANPETFYERVRGKRWNDPREATDGYRLLVCRHRPRGVRKEDETWDAWCQHLAPSRELLDDYHGKRGAPIAWDAYTERYLREMERQRFWIQGFADRVRAGETLTLLCSSACVDSARCHRTLLRELLVAAAVQRAREP